MISKDRKQAQEAMAKQKINNEVELTLTIKQCKQELTAIAQLLRR